MKKILALVCAWFCMIAVQAQPGSPTFNLVPFPASLTQQPGSFILKPNTLINVTGTDTEAWKIARQLSGALSTPTGYNCTIAKNAPAAAIHISLLAIPDAALGTEGYQLAVTPKNITIKANKPAGLFYAVQTLLQLFPKEIESRSVVKHTTWPVPCVSITDQPRLGWRGLMFDVSRHFFTKQEVKQFIDDMVRYKYNLLHLHLTDDQGWRIEIKSLPRLTETGAWRVKREGRWGNTPAPDPNEPKTYGGFYTQEDIRELVQYAKDRYVAILPEIDRPGHSMAAIASYPELSGTPGNYHVNAGDRFMDWSGGGPVALADNNLCPANEQVYAFLDKVFTEVAQLFPFEYIHMSGDECAKNLWAKNDAIKGLMEKEGLKTMDEVQSYFVKRVEKIIQSKGKKMMGWDEILEGGLAPDASVMSWRGMKGGIAAAKMNHHVVMSPTDFVYLDYYQGEPSVEPPVYAGLRLNKTYQFDPLPEGVDPKFILGGQGNLWTEQIANYRSVQYMTWPRGLAIAETLWSPKDKKNWNDFANRVQHLFPRMDEAGIKYAKGIYDPIISAGTDAQGNLIANLDKEIEDLDIYYSFDESNPDNYYPKYTSPLLVPKDAATLKVITYRHGKQAGRQINLPIADLKKRIGKK